MSERFAPPPRFSPRSIRVGEIPALSSPGFGLDNWRRDVRLIKKRIVVRHKIFQFLAQYASSDLKKETAEFSNALERHLFAEAMSKESYLDQLSFNTRLNRLIQGIYINRIIVRKGSNRASRILHSSPAAGASCKAKNGAGKSHSGMLCTNNINQPHSCFRSATSSASKGKVFELEVSTFEMRGKPASGGISPADEGGCRKRTCYTAEASPVGHKRFEMNNLSLKTSYTPNTPTALNHTLSPDGPLTAQQIFLSNGFSHSGVIELMEVDTVHEKQLVNSDAVTKTSIDHLLRSDADEVHNVAEVQPVDCRKMDPTRTWNGMSESVVNYGTICPKVVPILSQEQHITDNGDTVVTAEFDKALPKINTKLQAEGQHVFEKEKLIMEPFHKAVPETNARLLAQEQHNSDYGCVIAMTKFAEVVPKINTEALAEGQRVVKKEEGFLMAQPTETVSESNAGLLSQEQNSADKEGVIVVEEFDDTASEVYAPLVADSNARGTHLTSENQTISRLSLIEFFTADEVNQHQQSLRPSHQIAAEEVSEGACCDNCQHCYSNILTFPPLRIYCFSCNARIKDHVTYYSMVGKNGACTCICFKCYREAHGNIKMIDPPIPKSKLEEKKNNAVTEEPWVQCDKCDKWQHQICALIIDKGNVKEAKYICPKCYIEELNRGERFPDPQRTGIGARDLPSTKLSAHIEDWLLYHLRKEREERARAVGKDPDEVPGADDLIVRVVSSVDKELEVRQQFLDIFPDKRYPKQFPYRSKEFGSESSPPNRRCVNIAYIDSVKYFRPEVKTTKGEALRTFVYHQVLNGYLDYCKKRGFAICYIWVCPPVKGENYILHRHPPEQQTPLPGKLKLWYQEVFKEAIKHGVAVHFTSLQESIFAPNAAYTNKITAARLPYDGEYLSDVVEGVINKILEDSDRDIMKKFEQIQRRSLRATGCTNASVRDAKDVILMDKLNSMKLLNDQFFVIYLHFMCNSCNEVILSGTRWFCKSCKNYQLCERCHQSDTHTANYGQEHKLSKGISEKVPADTEDNDIILDKSIMESRDAFLGLCQEKFYQFDTLRRAKHSSTMMLYHLHNATKGSIQKKNASATNVDDLTHRSPPVDEKPDTINAEKDMGSSDIVLHTFKCRQTYLCTNPDCRRLKGLIIHAKTCKVRVSGGCKFCPIMLRALAKHAKNCKNSNCGIPKCKDLKNSRRHASHDIQ